MLTSKLQAERPEQPEWRLSLLWIALSTAAFMLAFETTKQFVFPHITIWHSHLMTIAFTSASAVVAAYLVGARLAKLNQELRLSMEQRNADFAKLEESEAHNAAILQSSLDCIISVNDRGKITAFNPAAEKAFGISGSEAFGKPLADIIATPALRDSRREGVVPFLLSSEPGLVGKRIETTGVRADGTEFPVELGIIRVELPGPSTFTAFLRDLTENKKLEQQLLRAQKMESIGRLAGGIAHDFNNLLTIILGYASRLSRRGDSDEEFAHDIKGIENAAGRAATLVRQLLAFSRQQVLQPRTLDLNTIVHDIARMLPRVLPEQIEIVTLTAGGLGSITADCSQLEQVIVNLALNARDAMPKGGKLTLETANVALDERYGREHISVEPGRYVMLAVSDTGVGMDAATQDHIFEPFFTTKEVGKGTGLGLSSAYGIVKQSGGNIWVYSEVGRGTTFKIYFPRVDAATDKSEQEKKIEAKSGNETILLVEDNRELMEVAKGALKDQGYTVLAADTPMDAERLSSQYQGRIHLLLTDIVMPKMNGWELAHRLGETRTDMKICYMSGYTENVVMPHGEAAAGTTFLQKPFAPAVLATKVRELLDSVEAPRRSAKRQSA
jgi:two-component system, cell cycle sensor histidine kinase and response regulator CckA